MTSDGRTAGEESMAGGQTAAAVGFENQRRVPKGNGSISASRPPAQSRPPTATRFQERLNRLPLQEGKVKEGDKDEEGKGGRRRKKKKVEEGRKKERASLFFFV
ncbi:hypothetical protein LINPERHAP2_LOCUS41336 [Linum perenne]